MNEGYDSLANLLSLGREIYRVNLIVSGFLVLLFGFTPLLSTAFLSSIFVYGLSYLIEGFKPLMSAGISYMAYMSQVIVIGLVYVCFLVEVCYG